MIIKLYNLDNCISTCLDDCVCVIECENRTYFMQLLKAFKGISSDANEVGIVQNDKLADINKICVTVADFCDFDPTDKTIINRLYKAIIEHNESEIDVVAGFNGLFQDIVANIENLTADFNLNLQHKNSVDIKEFLHFVGLTPCKSDNAAERILDYIDLISRLKIYEVLVLVNPKSCFSDEDLIEIYKQSLYKNIKLILLESVHRDKKLKYETKIYIDEDVFDMYC